MKEEKTMKKMMIYSAAFMLALAWTITGAPAAHAQAQLVSDLVQLAEIADTQPELLEYAPRTTFRSGCYRVELLYESSLAEDVNEFGWTKSPFCLTAVPVELSHHAEPVMAVKKLLCACGGFHMIFAGDVDPITTRYVYIPEQWAPALNSPSIRSSHGGGYYTSLSQYNWDKMSHIQIYEEIDPTGVSDTPSWLLLWMDTCSPRAIPLFFDDMILKITYVGELCPVEPVEELEEVY